MYKRLFGLSILMWCAFHAVAADFSTPTGRVKDSIEKVITILKDQTLDREVRWQRIAAVIKDGFDFRSMSQSVLATNWQKATPEEQQQFTEYFTQYIEATYRAKIEAYTDEKVVYKEETIKGDRATVNTVIVTSTTEIPVDFKLKNNDGQWYAYDVVIEGISLVSNYRATFAAIVKNEGMDGLMSDIQRRIDKYKADQAAQGTQGGGEDKDAAVTASEG
jgi:phospholipid transport system substrate-binding protein